MRKIIWFNPPYNMNLKTNLGKEFLSLIDKNIPIDNPLSKIINRKTVKISYSCTNNIRSIITTHNQKVLSTKTKEKQLPCNCQSQCILPGNCRAECVVYKATANHPASPAQYIGSTSNEFKVRFRNHKASFKNENKKSETALSQYVWANQLNTNDKNENITPSIKWEILKSCQLYKGGQQACDLCTTEKFFYNKK